MELLPLELHEQIFAYVLRPRKDWTNILTAPVSAKPERDAIYRLRLTSRRINIATLQSFVQIIGDMPRECSEESISNLINLLALEQVSQTITCLTFSFCKLVITEKQTLTQLNARCLEIDQWIQHKFHYEVLDALAKLPQLHHVVCFLEAMRGSYRLGFGGGQMATLERSVRGVSDPFLVREC